MLCVHCNVVKLVFGTKFLVPSFLEPSTADEPQEETDSEINLEPHCPGLEQWQTMTPTEVGDND